MNLGAVRNLPKGFDEFGRLTGINFGNGVGTDFSYYPISQRLKDAITKLAHGTQIQNLLDGYDQAGNITKITDSIAAHAGSGSATITGTVYDDLNRLTSATWSGYGTKTYSYDAVGNTLMNGEAGAGTYSYGTARPQAVKSANGKNYTYSSRWDSSRMPGISSANGPAARVAARFRSPKRAAFWPGNQCSA